MSKKKSDKLNDRFYRVLENLFRELDQDALKLEVEALKQRMPDASREKLIAILTKRAALKAAFSGAGAGAPGGALGLLAMGPDIYNLVRQQSRLVLSIAFIYEQEPHLDERIREVVATLAISTGASASRRGVRYLISRGLAGDTFRKMVRKIAGKYAARKAPAAFGPLIGGAAGAAINYAAVKSISALATDYYRDLHKVALTASPPALEGSEALPESRIVDTTATSRDEKKKGTEKKKATKKKSKKKKKATGKKKTTGKKKAGEKKATSKKRSSQKKSSKKSKSRKGSTKKKAGKKKSSTKKKSSKKKSSPKKSSGSSSGKGKKSGS